MKPKKPVNPLIERHRIYIRQALQQHRQATGLTQAAAAKQCGISRSVYAHAENGHGKAVSIERLLLLADALGMPYGLICYPAKPSSGGNGQSAKK